MNSFRFKTILLVTFIIIAAAAQTLPAATHVWFTLEKPFPAVYPGAVFTTDLKISSANGIVGAIDVILRYDSSVITLLEFTTASSSGFDSDCFAQPPGVASGQTRIACFQVSNETPPGNPRTLGAIRWQATGPIGSQTDVSIEPKTVTDTQWSSVEVMSFGQQVTVTPVTNNSDLDVTALANTVQPVFWYYININNNWYIVDATASSNPAVMLLKSVDVNVDGGIRWKPINNRPAFAGFPAADIKFSSITASADGRTLQFGPLISPQTETDQDVIVLANTTLPVRWFYIAINDMSKWYITEANAQSDPAVMLLRYVDPDWEGGIRWKPISNYPAYADFPAAPVNYQSISISQGGKTITFGDVK